MGKSFIKLPKIGESIPKATLVSWLKDVGDEIEKGDPLIEISIDQVNSFVPSEFSGELKEKRFKIGDIIEPGEVIAEIENENEDEDEDEIDEGESNPENELNTNTQNLVEAGTKSAIKSSTVITNSKIGLIVKAIFKSSVAYFVSSGVIIASITWFIIETNADAEIAIETESNIQEKEVEAPLIPEQIIIPKSLEIIEEEVIPLPKKIKTPPVVKVNKIEKKKIEEDEEEELDIDVPFAVVEDVPIFPGCIGVEKYERRDCFTVQINKHIRRTFRYPEIAKEMGIQGRVYVNFIISKDGSITNIRVRGPDKILEEEAIRIISLLPRLLPGKQNGKPVRVPFSSPITFRLQ